MTNECDREAPCRQVMNRNWVEALQKKVIYPTKMSVFQTSYILSGVRTIAK
jgi:hypothetical protein